MKKIILSLFICLFICTLFAGKTENVSLTEQKLTVLFDGSEYRGINLYSFSESDFLSIKELAALFKANIEWQPVSRKINFKLNNRTVSVFFDSKKVAFGKKHKKLHTPSLFIDHELYVPVDLLMLEDFSDVTETVSKFSKKGNVLNITSKSNISAVRYYTKENSTRIEIELEENMTHTIKKAKNSFIVAFQRGKIAENSIIANNGAIKDICFKTQGREAVFTINLEQQPKSIKSRNYKKPLRLILDIEHTKPVDMTSPKEIYTASQEIKDIIVSETYDESESGEKNTEKKVKNEIEKETDNKTETTQKPALTTGAADETEPPVINNNIISNDSDIYDVPKPDYDDDDSEALSKVKVVSVTEEQVIDNSYEIIDDTDTFKDILPTKAEIAKVKDVKIIVLDAGHGGKDSGAIGPTGVKEKEINLEIVFALEKIFKKDKNYRTILTRDNDTFIPLGERTNIANKKNADLFISIHCNANFNRAVAGFEIYFLSENATDSEANATAILENSSLDFENKGDEEQSVLTNMFWHMMRNEHINESSVLCSFIVSEVTGRLKIPNKGIKQANFAVLRGSQMPAVLVECAYMSNYTEEAKLQTKSFQKSVADSVYEGVKKYYARKAKLEQQKD